MCLCVYYAVHESVVLSVWVGTGGAGLGLVGSRWVGISRVAVERNGPGCLQELLNCVELGNAMLVD